MTARCGLAALSVVLIACGGTTYRSTRQVRAALGEREEAGARRFAPDLLAQADGAIRLAEAAERRGDLDAARDYATRARLFLEASEHEEARLVHETERAEIEARIRPLLAQARADEAARAELSARATLRASARVARREAERALALAIEDEARRGRRARAGLEEARDLRRAAATLRARSRLLVSAARALGATDEDVEAAEASIVSSREARRPEEALAEADRAYGEALGALGRARSSRPSPPAAATRSLAELAQEAGFEAYPTDLGLAVESRRLFARRGSQVSAEGRARLARLARLAAAFPSGPVQVAASDQARSTAARSALAAEGVDEARLTTVVLDPALRGAGPPPDVRLVFLAYRLTVPGPPGTSPEDAGASHLEQQ
ncbi:MAG: hypothetical protein ACFCGT_08220 [Sandaracinaceae bacterium]